MKKFLLPAVAALAFAGSAHAAVTVSYEAPKVQNTTMNIGSRGVETFDNINAWDFTTDFGGSGYTGKYEGVHLPGADQYGGAGGAGKYAAAFSDPGFSVSLSGGANDAGPNYFGFWWSGVDNGNTVELFSKGVSLIRLSAHDVLSSVVGADANWAYKGNPNSAFQDQNYGERYAFVNFKSDQAIDKVVFSGWGGGFETDNHTVGFISGFGRDVAGAVPEPATWAMMIMGFFGIGAAVRRRRQAPQVALATA